MGKGRAVLAVFMSIGCNKFQLRTLGGGEVYINNTANSPLFYSRKHGEQKTQMMAQYRCSVLQQRIRRFSPMTLCLGRSRASDMITQMGEHAHAWWLNTRKFYNQTDVFIGVSQGSIWPMSISTLRISDGNDFLDSMQLQLGIASN